MKEKEEIMKVTNKLNTITLHQAKVALTITYENKILDFVLYNRALGNVVSSNQIIYKLWSIDEKYNEKSWSLLQKWCYHFMHRNYLNFRRSIHISQKHPENYLNRMQEFQTITLNLEANMILNWMQLQTWTILIVFKHTFMHNCTETWIWEINIRTQGQEIKE